VVGRLLAFGCWPFEVGWKKVEKVGRGWKGERVVKQEIISQGRNGIYSQRA